MSDKFINPLKDFKERIIYLSDSFPGYLIDKLKAFDIHLNETVVLDDTVIGLSKKKSWIEWTKYTGHNSFYYDFMDNEDMVRGWLENSKLREYSHVVMEFGHLSPISLIPMDIFIAYWYELLIIAGYESVVMTEDGKLFMEFIKLGYTLKSNFLIDPRT